MAKLRVLHERTFAGKPLKSLRLYDDPFGAHEICVEIAFVDGQIEFVSIGPGKPSVTSSGLCYEEIRGNTLHNPACAYREVDLVDLAAFAGDLDNQDRSKVTVGGENSARRIVG